MKNNKKKKNYEILKNDVALDLKFFRLSLKGYFLFLIKILQINLLFKQDVKNALEICLQNYILRNNWSVFFFFFSNGLSPL